MTAPTTPLDPPTVRDHFGRRLAARLWLASILFWWVLGIPFSWASLLLNDHQFHAMLVYFGWSVPLLGWAGVVLLPWWRWRRLQARTAAGDQATEADVARFPVIVGLTIFVTSCLVYLLGAIQLSASAALPILEGAKLILQGLLFGAVFGVAGGLRAGEGLHSGTILRQWVTPISMVLALGVALPLAMVGLTHTQSTLERERGELLLEALEDAVRSNTPLPDLSSFGEATIARVVDRATGTIQLGPEAGASIDTLGLDETGVIMTGQAGWSVSRSGRHLVVAHLPIALPEDPGVLLLAVSPLSDYGRPLWSAVASALVVLLAALGVVLPVTRRLIKSANG